MGPRGKTPINDEIKCENSPDHRCIYKVNPLNSMLMRTSTVGVFFTITLISLLLLSLGLAVPSINVNVQEVGTGSCRVQSPVTNATLTISWDPQPVWIIENRYYYSDASISVVFSDDLPAGTKVYLNITLENWTITGFWRWSKTDPGYYIYSTTLTSNLSAGQSLNISLPSSSDYLSYPYGYSLSVIEIKMVVLLPSGDPISYNTCPSSSISLNVLKVGVGSDKFSPSGAGNISLTVTERSGQNLVDYVVNFTLNGDWSSLYPYVTDENGNRLYYWYFYDSASQKTWFWVKMNLSAGQVTTLYLFYGNQSAYDATYFNPDKVFWFFDDFNDITLNLSKWNIPPLQTSSNYTVSNSLLELKSGQWLWTKQNFSGSFIIDLYANSLNSTAFPIFYVDNTSYGWAVLLNTSLATRGATTYQLDNVAIRGFNLINGSWGVFYYPDGGSGSPIFGKDILITTLINVTGTQAEFYLYENSSLIANFTQGYPAEQNEPLGLGQWYEYNYTITGPWWNPQLTLSSIINTTSIYDWILVRPYVYPEPEVRVLGQTSGNYTYRVYFKP